MDHLLDQTTQRQKEFHGKRDGDARWRQAYYAAQRWRRNQCLRLIEQTQRNRCLANSGVVHADYRCLIEPRRGAAQFGPIRRHFGATSSAGAGSSFGPCHGAPPRPSGDTPLGPQREDPRGLGSIVIPVARALPAISGGFRTLGALRPPRFASQIFFSKESET